MPIRRSLPLCLCFSALLFSLLPTLAPAQSTEPEIQARLLKQPLYLRGAWGENKLEFDKDGNAVQSYRIVPFTTAAMDVTKVRLKDARLHIDGQRVALRFTEKGQIQRVPLGHMKIEISGVTGEDFAPALDAIFARSLSGVPSANTGPWQQYAEAHWPSAHAPEDQAQVQPAKVGGSVKAPRVVKTADPVFSPVARALKFSGDVQIAAVVDASGSPEEVSIKRPAGLGLDEQATAAVSNYRFAPATRDGTPVPVQIYIDVNFQIF